MGFFKLREWVGTVTGKGDRWGRDRLGRSEPAFLSANTTALPPLTCTARGQHHHLQLLCCFCCEAGHLWPFVEACAGWRVHRLCPPAVACSAGCVPACLYLPCPLPSSTSCPRSTFCLPRSFCLPPSIPFCLCFACTLFMSCAPGSPLVRAGGLFFSQGQQFVRHHKQHVCKLQDCPVGSNNAGLQWRPALLLPTGQSCSLQTAGPD